MNLLIAIIVAGLFLEGVFYILGRYIAPQKNLTFDDENLFPEKALETAASPVALSSMERKERIIHELDFTSLADILLGSNLALKRGAIERLYQLKSPEAIQLLMQHRNDAHPDVRFYVTAALERIKHDYESDFHSAYLEMKKNIYKNSARLLLAKRYIDYLDSGLLDLALSQKYFEEAIFHLNEIVHSDTPLEDAHWMILDLYKKYPQKYAVQVFDILSRLENLKADPVKIHKVKVEILFNLGRYTEMKSSLASLQHITKEPEWSSVIAWWGIA